MINQPRGKHFFYILWGAVTLACLVLLWPFFGVIAIGAAFAVALYPVFHWFLRDLGLRLHWLAALLTVLLFLVVLGVPLYWLGARVVAESRQLNFSQLDSVFATIQANLPALRSLNIGQYIGSAASFGAGLVTTIFTTTLETVFTLFLALLALFYFLKDGDRWRRWVIRLSPLSDAHDERILTMLARAVNGVMKGYLLIALIQGFLLGLGLAVFGVPQAALWGVLAGLASMIPSIGTALVSLPAILYLFSTGSNGPAIGLLVWSVLLVGTVDNILSPLVMGKNVALPPLVVLFAVLGGIAILGAIGIIVGPLLVSLFYTLTRIYQEDFS